MTKLFLTLALIAVVIVTALSVAGATAKSAKPYHWKPAGSHVAKSPTPYHW